MWPVPLPSPARGQHRPRGLLDDGPRGEAERRVEVALQRRGPGRRAGAPRRAGPASRRPRRRSRRCAIRPSSSPVPTPKRMVGTPRSAMPSRTARVAGRAKRRVLVGRERAGPAVEELDRLGPGLDLGAQGGHGHGGQPVGQLLPQVGIAVHERLDLGEGARGPALDQVAGHGEGRAGEPDQGDARSRRAPGHQARPSRPRRAASVCGLERPQAREVGRRCGTARPPPAPGPARRRPRSRWRAAGTTMSENKMAASTP